MSRPRNRFIYARFHRRPVWPDWAIYWTLANLLTHSSSINLPKSSTFFGNFFQVKSFLGSFYRQLSIFSGHTGDDLPLVFLFTLRFFSFIFKKCHSRTLFLYFVVSIQLTVNIEFKFGWWLDSNCIFICLLAYLLLCYVLFIYSHIPIFSLYILVSLHAYLFLYSFHVLYPFLWSLLLLLNWLHLFLVIFQLCLSIIIGKY